MSSNTPLIDAAEAPVPPPDDDELVVETYYLACLAHASYLVAHRGRHV